MGKLALLIIPILTSLSLCGLGAAQAPPDSSPRPVILFQNVRVLINGQLSVLSNVLIRGNLIERVTTSPVAVDRSANTKIIDGRGRTLMPGLIDAHWHTFLVAAPMNLLLTADPGYLYLIAGHEAGNTLMRGFTSVRDVAGPSFGIKRAIDSGVISGPRIWPSGAIISQTSGHGDFRLPYEVPKAMDAPLSHGELLGAGVIADGRDQVLVRVREQLMLGASQIKLAAGGALPRTTIPSMSANTPRMSSTQLCKRQPFGELMSPSMPIHRMPSRLLSGPASSVLNTDSSPMTPPQR